MDATASEACCSADHADHRAGDAPDVRAADCCEARHLASLPTGASPRAPEALDAPAVALVTPMPTREALDRALAAVTRSLAPLDVPYDSRPPPSEARARLMVFLN